MTLSTFISPGHYDYADFSNFADYQRYRLLTEPERENLRQALSPPRGFASEELEEADRRLNEALPAFLRTESQISFRLD